MTLHFFSRSKTFLTHHLILKLKKSKFAKKGSSICERCRCSIKQFEDEEEGIFIMIITMRMFYYLLSIRCNQCHVDFFRIPPTKHVECLVSGHAFFRRCAGAGRHPQFHSWVPSLGSFLLVFLAFSVRRCIFEGASCLGVTLLFVSSLSMFDWPASSPDSWPMRATF